MEPSDNGSVKRIAIVGSIGSGKSTFANALGGQLGRHVVHLDELWWEPGSHERTPLTAKTRTMGRELWRQLNRDLVDCETWIIDGSLDLLRWRLERADLVVFIDLPRRVCMPRAARRWCASHRKGSSDVRGAAAWLWLLLRWGLEVPAETNLDSRPDRRTRLWGRGRPTPHSP